MVDWAEFIAKQDWNYVIAGIQLSLFIIAIVVGWIGFRKSEGYAMETINLIKENKRLRAEIAQLRIGRGEDPPAKPSWE